MEPLDKLDLTEAIERIQEENRRLRAFLESSDQGRILLEREKEFARLLEVSKLIVSELDVSKVFDLVATHAQETVDADLVLVPMLSEDRSQFTYVAASGDEADSVRGTTYKAHIGMCGWVLQHERSLLFGETSTNWMENMTPWEAGQQSAVLVPLFGREGIIGGLSALGKRGGGPFTRHDLDLLTMFANQVSIAIENALQFEQRMLFEQGLRDVNECLLAFGSNPVENIRLITGTTGKILKAVCALYNRKEGDFLRTLAGWQIPPDMPPVDRGQGHICFDVIDRDGDDPIIIRDLHRSTYAQTDPNVSKYGLKLYVGYPVKSAEQKTVASLCAVFQNQPPLASYQINLLRVLGKAASVEEERLRVDVALRASEARFRAIIENASVGIVAAEPATGRILYVNPVVCTMMGYEADEMINRNIRSLHPASELPRVENSFARMEGLETLCVRKDGSQFSVDIKPVMLELDGAPYAVGFFTDFTERHLLEEERLKTQKLEAIGKLAGGIAHDFNNLLQAIFGNIHMAKLGLPPESGALTNLKQAEDALQQSVNLTNQLLTFSKGGKPVRKLTDLHALIENSTRFILSGSRSAFNLIIPPDLWLADVDEGQIGQVIQNIVLNANQAMPQGGTITVTAENVPEAGPPLPPGLAPGNYVRISVQDAGIGIPEEHLGRIFDPYFTTKEKGSGLGLATAYSITRNHGGLIDVMTRPGSGSTFNIYLPANPSATRPTPEVKAPEPSNTRKARILVMDDEESLRVLIGQQIQVLGHDAVLACDGEEAIEKYREARTSGAPVDIVILDLTIRGGMGGQETLQRLFEMDPGVKAVVSSGYSDDDAMAEHLSQGFRACLRKPYKIGDLRDTLNALIG